jgi:DNA-binding response OmpR family regulator
MELEGYKGADIYIKKPFDGEVLLNQMINIHNKAKQEKSGAFLALSKDHRYRI